jgi:hypothetical protein
VIVGSQTVRIAAGDHRTVTISLNRKGTQLLQSAHRLHAVLTASSRRQTLESTSVTFTAPAAGSSRTQRSRTRHSGSTKRRSTPSRRRARG